MKLNMDSTAVDIVKEFYSQNKIEIDQENFEIFIVWKSKVLQNYKYLLGSNHNDNLYFEITYNGDKDEWYLDVYDKLQNITVKVTQDE